MPCVGVLQRRRFGEADDAVLGGDVAGGAGPADQAGGRGHVEDRARALLGHRAELVLGAEEDAVEVDVDDLLPAVERRVRRRCRATPRMPAQLKAPSSRPSSATAAATAASTEASSVTSQCDVGGAVAELGGERLALLVVDVGEQQPRALGAPPRARWRGRCRWRRR